MLYLTCTTITGIDLAHYGVSRAKDWVSVKCGTSTGGRTVLYQMYHDICFERCCRCIVVLRPRETSKVMSGRSVNLTTLFLGRLRPPKRLTSTSCTYFRQ